MPITIELLERDEYEAALNVLVQCFGEDYRKDAETDLSATFADYPYTPVSFLAKSETVPIGFVQAITSYFHRNTYSIAWLCVVPQYRRQGFAAQIMRAAENYVVGNRFKNKVGSFMLVAAYNSDYYESLGYLAGLKTYDGFPIMIKHFLNTEASSCK